jgi:hypothetical protein
VEIKDLRESFLASISGAQAGEVRDISFLYNIGHEFSAVRAYQLADEDAKKHFGVQSRIDAVIVDPETT